LRSALVLLLLFASGCRTGGKTSSNADGGSSSSSNAGDAGLGSDAELPETVVIVLEAGADPNRLPAPAGPAQKVELMSGLPQPCQDRLLGTVTFAQNGDAVVITSSKTKARAACHPKDSHTLVCDWVGMDGKPGATQKPVTYGFGKPIGGSFDKTHAFRCAPQR
jgi:hypothetical protein